LDAIARVRRGGAAGDSTTDAENSNTGIAARLQLLIVEAPAEIPPARFSSTVLLVINDRFGPATPAPVLKWLLQSITVRLLTPLVVMPARHSQARQDLIVEPVPSWNRGRRLRCSHS
jgi:hypothetical protein